jgi:hypothetical protein
MVHDRKGIRFFEGNVVLSLVLPLCLIAVRAMQFSFVSNYLSI